jgi:hypothetical protein
MCLRGAGVTLEDVCVRHDLFSVLAVPIQLQEGTVRRLHIGGDWSFSSGLRPRVDITGVRIRARISEPSAALAPRGPLATGGNQSVAIGSAISRPTAAVARKLLRAVILRVEDAVVVIEDTLSLDRTPLEGGARRDAYRPATMKFAIDSIATVSDSGAAIKQCKHP